MKSTTLTIAQWIGGLTLLTFFGFLVLILLYGLGALFAYFLNFAIDVLRSATHLDPWQGMACLILGAVIYHFTRRR